MGALLLIPSSAQAQRQAPDFRRAWTCGATNEADGIVTSVLRELDREGKQLSVGVQWFVDGLDGDRLSLSAVLAGEGLRDPPPRQTRQSAGDMERLPAMGRAAAVIRRSAPSKRTPD